jgi:hypothetical protein
LRIEAYFRQVNEAIADCAVVQTFNVTYDKRGTHEGFIRGEIYFRDGSRLQFREFVDVEIISDRLMYSYHFTDTSGQFVFRYDNTGHHKNLNLSTHPHHKHDGHEQKVVISNAPDFVAVLAEVEKLIHLP